MKEYSSILNPLGYELISLADAGILEQADETGTTFEENSLIKSTYGHEATGLPCLADDSGLEIDALCGEPGIYSARYGGENLSDMDRINLVLRNLETAPSENRIARFVCSISIVGLTAQPLAKMLGLLDEEKNLEKPTNTGSIFTES